MRKYLVELFPYNNTPSIHLMEGETVEEVKEKARKLMGVSGYIDVYPINRDRNYLLYLGEVE